MEQKKLFVEDIWNKARLNLMSTTLLGGVFVFLGYFFYYLSVGDYVGSVLEILSVVFIGLILGFLRKTRKIRVVAFLALIFGMLFIVTLTYSNDSIGQGSFLAHASYVVVAYFLVGKKWGLVWSMVLIGSILFAPLASKLGYSTVYVGSEMLSLMVDMVFLVVILYFYQKVQERSIDLVDERTEELQISNEKLREEVEATARVESVLENKTRQLQKINKLMVGRELRMKELKRKLREASEGAVVISKQLVTKEKKDE